MGKQVQFFMHSTDMQDFAEAIEKKGFVIFPRKVNSKLYDEKGYVSPIKPSELDVGTERFFITYKELNPVEVFYTESKFTLEISYMNAWGSPVIEVINSRQSGKKLFNGRIYLGVERSVLQYELINRSYEKLKRIICKFPKIQVKPARSYYYIGENAMMMVERKELELFWGEPNTKHQIPVVF